jgi:hypothetical protein
MKRRNSSTPDQHFVSTEQGLATTRSISSPRPVGGEMFFLTAPFRERWATTSVYQSHVTNPSAHSGRNSANTRQTRPSSRLRQGFVQSPFTHVTTLLRRELRAVFTSGGPFGLTNDLVWAGTILGQTDEARLRLGCAGVSLWPKAHADSCRDSSSKCHAKNSGLPRTSRAQRRWPRSKHPAEPEWF